MKLALTNFSLSRPWMVILLVLMITAILASQFPKVQFDNDPENMLSADLTRLASGQAPIKTVITWLTKLPILSRGLADAKDRIPAVNTSDV